MSCKSFFKPCQPPFFLECAILQSIAFVFVIIYVPPMLRQHMQSLESLAYPIITIQQSGNVIEGVFKLLSEQQQQEQKEEKSWFAQHKSIIPAMPNTNSRGINYSEWYMNDGDGILSEKEAELPNEYRDCIIDINVSITCNLPHDISFKVIEYLAEGKTGTTWVVELNKDEKYVLKFADKWSKCRNIQSEWRLMYLIYEPDLNMPYIHPSMPFYWFNSSCFIFISYVKDSWPLNDLNLFYVRPKLWKNKYPSTFTKYTLIQSFNEIDDGILDFFMNCYKDILRVLKAIYLSLHILYNDLHPGNIFVNNMDHSCTLIDFGSMFHRQMITGNQRGKNLFEHGLKYKCERISCNPISHYHLRYRRDRNTWRWIQGVNMTDKQAANVLMEYAWNGLRYNLFSKLLHIFIQYYVDAILHKYDKAITKILSEKNRDLMSYCVGPSIDVLQRVWCRRNEIVEILKQKTNDLQGSTKSNTTKQEFWKLVHEMYANDTLNLNCSEIPRTMKCD